MSKDSSPKKQAASTKSQPDAEYFIESSYDPVTGMYYPMKWEEFHKDKTTTHQSDRVALWNVHVDASISRKRRNQEESSESEEDGSDEELVLETISEESDSERGHSASEDESMAEEPPVSDDDAEKGKKAKGSTKKRKRGVVVSTVTPSKKRRKTTQPTPHSKAAMRARKKFKIRPPSALTQDDNSTLLNMEDDPYLRAMYTLHVGERPDTLPCRDEEYVNIFENVLGLLQETSGGCICEYKFGAYGISNEILPDISGVPGTGKTATVHTIIRELKTMATNNVGFSLYTTYNI